MYSETGFHYYMNESETLQRSAGDFWIFIKISFFQVPMCLINKQKKLYV